MNISEQLRRGDDLKLPAELHIANGDNVTCTKLIQISWGRYRSVVLKGWWKSKTVLVKMLLGKRRSAHFARREHNGYSIANSLNIKTPELYFIGRCDGGYVAVFKFIEAVTLHDLWQSQPQRHVQIADWGINLLVKLHRHGCRHVDFHFNNFLESDDVFYVIDVQSIRAASRSLRMGTLLRVPKEYGYWQRHNIAQCFARYDPQTHKTMMDALRRNYPAAGNDPKLAAEIDLAKIRRVKRQAKSGRRRHFWKTLGNLFKRENNA